MKIFLILILALESFAQEVKTSNKEEILQEPKNSVKEVSKDTNQVVVTENQNSKKTDEIKKQVLNPDNWKVDIFGFLKADYVFSNKALLSYGYENLSAPNQVKREVQLDDRDPRSLISIRETSLGFKPQYGKKVYGVVQFDLMDVSQASPGPGGKPRVVQAYFGYKSNERLEFFAGQKWDIFSPLYPDTYNIISGLYSQGNSGWFREQMGFSYQSSSSLKMSLALGNTTTNSSQTVSRNLELNNTPTFATQFQLGSNENNLFYISTIYSTIKVSDPYRDRVGISSPSSSNLSSFESGVPINYDFSIQSVANSPNTLKPQRVYRDAGGISFGWQYKTERLSLKTEFTHGRNLGDLNTLTTSSIQRNRGFNTIVETGFWISILYKWNADYELGFLLGAMKINNPNSLTSPTVATVDSSGQNILRERDFSLIQFNTATSGVWGNSQLSSVQKNHTVGFSVAKNLEGDAKLFFQYQWMETEYYVPNSKKGFQRYLIVDSNRFFFNEQGLASAMRGEAGPKPNAHLIRMGVMINF
jgi:hypothetical protein